MKAEESSNDSNDSNNISPVAPDLPASEEHPAHPVQPQVQPNDVTPDILTCKIESSDGYENIRSTASANESNLVTKLNRGATVTVLRELGSWSEIEFQQDGKHYGKQAGQPVFVHSSLLDCP